LNIRFATRAFRGIDHLFAIRGDVEVVKVGPYGTRREKSLGRNNGGEPNIE